MRRGESGHKVCVFPLKPGLAAAACVRQGGIRSAGAGKLVRSLRAPEMSALPASSDPAAIPGEGALQNSTGTEALSFTDICTPDGLALYYAHRAGEFEEAYRIPERQADLAQLAGLLRELVAGERVLEVACGTGYWTQIMARTATSILATDINEPMLDLARERVYGRARVEFALADAWHLENLANGFTAGVAMFWWSHLPRSRISDFLTGFHAGLQSGARVVFADHLQTDCRWMPPVRVDEEGNTYQRRTLHTGEVFDVIKNYSDESEVRTALKGLATDVHYTRLASVWLLDYRAAAT